jgi:hypothetical protein
MCVDNVLARKKTLFFYLQNGNGSRDCGFKNGLFFQRGAKDILCQTYFENTFWHLSDGSLSISLEGVDCVVKKYFSCGESVALRLSIHYI